MDLGCQAGRSEGRIIHHRERLYQVHQALMEQGQLDLVHAQADEIRVKGRKLIAWMGLAMMVPTRLWLAEVVSVTRDRVLADRLLRQVRACAQAESRGVGVYRWGGGLSQQYPARLPREGQNDCRTGTSVLAGLAAVADWRSHETYRQVPPDPLHAADGAGNVGAGHDPAGSLTRRPDAQYRVY